MDVDFKKLKLFLIDRKAFSFGNSFHVYDPNATEIMFVDMPSFRLVKKLNFYTDSTKREKLFYVKQNKVMFLVNAVYTLYDADDNPVAYLKADLGENIYKRSLVITDPQGKDICKFAEQSTVSGLLGILTKGSFVFLTKEYVLGTFQVKPPGHGVFVLELTDDHPVTLDRRIALAAAIILYARVI